MIIIKIDTPKKPFNQDEAIEIAEYINDAIRHWGGQRHPKDWLFSRLEVKTIDIGKLRFKGDQL